MSDAAHTRAAPGARPCRAVPGQRILDLLLATAVAVSIVHYTDNYTAFESYPQATSGPSPTATTILAAWFGFTAFGLTGYLLYRRGRVRLAAVCLGVYSLSGLVGIGHYTAPGMTAEVWWRQAHVVADIACGVAVLAFAVWCARLAPAPAARR